MELKEIEFIPIGFMWLRMELATVCCEHGNELSSYIKGSGIS
jgi:hypothetical protein